MSTYIKDALIWILVMAAMWLITIMALDAWTYETYGDCEHCMVLDGYFQMRGE